MTKHSDVRNRIVETAGRLFYMQGYNSTGTNQIIAEAEVAKASLYQHFATKEDLLIEYLSRTSAETLDAIRALAEPKKTIHDKIRSIFGYLYKFSKQNAYNGCAFLNIASEVSQENIRAQKIIQHQKDSIRKIFKEILQPVHREKLADQFYLLFEGALAASKVHKSKWPIDVAQDCALRML